MASAWDGQGMASGIDTASDSRFLMEVEGPDRCHTSSLSFGKSKQHKSYSSFWQTTQGGFLAMVPNHLSYLISICICQIHLYASVRTVETTGR